MSAINLSRSGLRRYATCLQALIIMVIVLLPISAIALEQTINPTFTTNVTDWNPSWSAGGYADAACGYDAVGGGSIEAMIGASKDNFPDSVMQANGYQNLFGGAALASDSNIEVTIQDYYSVSLVVPPKSWSISATGGLYKTADGSLVGSLFRQESYTGTLNQALTGPNPSPATWTATLTGGAAYSIRLNWILSVAPPQPPEGNNSIRNRVFHYFDNVHCNISPSGLQISENAAGNAVLTWHNSNSPAGGNYVLNNYKIYSSPTGAEPWTLVGTSTIASYEHNPAENDLYYCITDVDKRGIESPKSVPRLYRRTRIEITQVSSPKTSVTQGQGGVPVTATLMNPGPSDISFGGASLTFKIPAVGQYNWTKISPAAGSIIAKNGGILTVTFSVDVLASSTPDTDWIYKSSLFRF